MKPVVTGSALWVLAAQGCLLAQTSNSLLNDWQVSAAYQFKCTETNPLWFWQFGNEGGQPFVSTPNFEHRSMFEEGPYLVNVDPITRVPRPWAKFKMTVEYRGRDLFQVPPKPKVHPPDAVFPMTCTGLPDKPPPPTSNEHFSNSGVYIYDRYEVLIVDPSRFIPPVAEGAAINSQMGVGKDGKSFLLADRFVLTPGSMYKVNPPSGQFINRAKPWPNAAQQWNTMEIVFCPPDPPPAKIRTKLNGFVVWEGELKGADGKPLTGTGSRNKGEKDKVDPGYVRFLKSGSILLQSHWGSRVDYRNPAIEAIGDCPVKVP